MDDKTNWIGTWKTREGNIAIILHKYKEVVDGKEEIRLFGYLKIPVTLKGSYFDPIISIWDNNGNCLSRGRENDLIEIIRKDPYK